MFALTLASGLYSQNYPKVPAEYPEYKYGMELLVNSGITLQTEWNYVIYNGNVTAQKFRDKVTKFDGTGKIMEIEHVDALGRNTSIEVLKYDAKSLPVLQTEFMPTGELIGKTTYKYNSQGFLQEITWYNGNEYIISKTEFETDSSMNSVTESNFFAPDSVKEKTVYFYSDLKKGRVEKEQHYLGKKQLDKTIVYHYLDDGRLEKEETAGPDGKTTSYLEYRYNAKGMLQEKVRIYNTGEKIKEADYSFNDQGLPAGLLEYNQKGGMVKYVKYTYNDLHSGY